MHYTYVLEGLVKKTGANRLYVGSTHNLANRVCEHQAGEVKSTKALEKLRLVYYEACINKTDARKRELQLKTGFGRGYLKRRLDNYFHRRA